MPKIKLYKDEEGNLKGDCSICYNAKESVEMAVSYLDEGYIRPTHKIRVTKAEFEAKDDAATDTTTSTTSKPSSSGSTSAAPSKRYKISSAQVKVAKSAMNQVRIVCIYIVCV